MDTNKLLKIVNKLLAILRVYLNRGLVKANVLSGTVKGRD